jgi:5-methylcytosine-specific restriction endonuclease McrA
MRYEVDHVIPRNRGGSDELANKQASHRRCNRAKSDRLDGGPVMRRSSSLIR